MGISFSARKIFLWACALLLSLGLLNILYGPLRNVLVAQSRAEIILASVLLVSTLAVILFFVVVAFAFYTRLPRVDSIVEEKFGDVDLRDTIYGSYLAKLPAENDYAQRLGVSADHVLIRQLQSLRAMDRGDASAVVAEFKVFQGLQKEFAGKIIRNTAILVGIKTAASPWRFVDMIAVFYNSTRMVRKIAAVYNRRVGPGSALWLLIGWFFNLYVSGSLGQLADGASNALGESLGEYLGEGGAATAMSTASKFVGKIAEGGLNAYLTSRLGWRAVDAFQYMSNMQRGDLRTQLALQTAQYLESRFALKRQEILPCLIRAFQSEVPLSGKLAEILLGVELVVRKLSAEALEYELQLYVRSGSGNALRAKIPVAYETDCALAPREFREKIIRERMTELKVMIHPAA